MKRGINIIGYILLDYECVKHIDYKPYFLIRQSGVLGVPARIIKWRFPEEVIRQLEDIGWYEWDIDKVKENKAMLESIVHFDIDDYWSSFMHKKAFLNISEENGGFYADRKN